MGRTSQEIYIPYDLKSGEYQLQLLAYDQDDAKGTLLTTKTINFKTQGAVYDINKLTFVNAETGVDIKEFTYGSRINIPPGGLSIRADVDPCVDRVKFVVRKYEIVNGIVVLPGRITRFENQAPYTLLGEDADGDLNPWYPDETGLYYFDIFTYSSENPDADYKDRYFAIFYVDGLANPNNEQEAQFTMYPNPIHQGDLHLNLEYSIDTETQVIIRDKQGNVKMTQSINSQNAAVDTRGLEPGVYFVELQNGGEVLRKLLMIN